MAFKSKLILYLLLFFLFLSQGIFAQGISENYKILNNSDDEDERITASLELLAYYSKHSDKDSIFFIINELKNNVVAFNEKKLDYRIAYKLDQDNGKLALPYFKKSFKLAIINNDSLYLALSKLKIASSDSLRNFHEECSKYLFEALAYFEKASHNEELDETYYQIGELFLRVKEIEKSRMYFLKGDSIARISGDKRVEAYISNGLANVYFFEDSIKKSLSHFHQALDYFREKDEQEEVALIENNISIALYNIGRKEESLEHAKRSLKARILLSDTAGISGSSLNIAFFLNEQENYDSALYYLNQAIVYAKLRDKLEVLNRSYEGISSVYQHKGDFENALKFHKLFQNLNDSIYKNERLEVIQQYEKEKEVSLRQLNNELEIQTYKNKIQRNIFLIVVLLVLLVLIGIILLVVYRSSLTKKKHSDEIFQNLQFLEKLMETVPDPIYYRDQNEVYVGCNRAFCELVGKEKGQIIGKTREQVFDKFRIKEFADIENNSNISTEILKFERRFVEGNGKEVFLQFHSAPFYISKRNLKGIIGLIIDITKQKNIENDLREANESKELFLSIISHDIRNAFNVVLAFTSLLNEDYDYYSDKKRIELISNIHEASNNTFLLLENLLGWSRAKQGGITIAKKETDIEDLIEESVALLLPASKEKNITIINKISPEVLTVDENSIKTVFRNLISNAIKYTPNGGEIIIYSEFIDKCYVVSFKDNGVGISKDKIDLLFKLDKNNQCLGTNNESGSGLGLTLSYELMKLNEGRIKVKSEEGKGSVFSVFLHQG